MTNFPASFAPASLACLPEGRWPIKYLVFDLDGTLIDSAKQITQAVNLVMAQIGQGEFSPRQIRNMIGDGPEELLRQALFYHQRPPNPAELSLLTARYRYYYAQIPISEDLLYPGAKDLLASLCRAGVKLGLCTNKDQGATEDILHRLDLRRYFGAVIGGDVLGVRKPHGQHVAAVLKALCQREGEEGGPAAGQGFLPIDAALMVGDHRNDILAAQDLGMRSIALAHGYARQGAKALGATGVACDLYELAALLTTFAQATG
jgi:phosphoglycolate phosphatase